MDSKEIINELEGLGIYVQSMHIKATFQEYQTISIEGYIKKVEKKMNSTIITQSDAINAVRSGMYIIGTFNNTGNFSASQSPVVHSTAGEARIEAKRLAKLSPGIAFVILKLAGAEMVPTNSISI